MARDRPVSKLELLPIFIQTEIIILLAKHSIDAVRNVLSAFPQLCPSFQQPSGLYKHESPSPNRSIIVISTQVPETDLCLSAGNLDHYYTIKVNSNCHTNLVLRSGDVPTLQLCSLFGNILAFRVGNGPPSYRQKGRGPSVSAQQ